MLKKHTYILFLGLSVSLFSCSEASTETNLDSDSEETTSEIEQDQPELTSEDEVISEVEDEAPVQYDASWESFKTAVVNKDIKGVSAFASSDKIDAEFVVQAFSDPEFLALLKKAKYEDLEIDNSSEEEILKFSGYLETSDDEGNIYESGLYLYFTKGETGLLLEDFQAAG